MIRLPGKFKNSWKYEHNGYLYYEIEGSSGIKKFRCVNYRMPCHSIVETSEDNINIKVRHVSNCELYHNYVAEAQAKEKTISLSQ